MPAGKHNIYIEQGATWSLPLRWQDADENPMDLTGFTARMHIRKKVTDPAFEIELTTEDGGITLGGADGSIGLFISATDTAAIDIKTGAYDLELISPGGVVTRLLEGAVTVSFEVTR
jgi:hypothetical protein